MRRLFPTSFYNLITLAGAAIASVSFGLILFLTILEFFAEQQKPYMGIIAFVILPAILLIGIGVMVAGVLREHRLERLGKPHVVRLPQIDLNNPRHRTALVVTSIGGILLLMFSAFGSFKAYEYTDSDEFCGQMCHAVMSPEYTAYQYSPHAKVGCVECHIGSGATWFVRSKLSGAYQVYSTMANKYPRPIPTPIENLRPAQETCEQCHWPKHFFSEKQVTNTYYMSDEHNTRWTLNLLMKIGGGNVEAGPTSGIHWHMNITNEVTYAHLDTQRQVIAWVKSKHADGREVTFWNSEVDSTDPRMSSARVRRMDCVDCHNRPTHIYHPPARSVNHVMALGWIDPKIPNAKSIAVQALEGVYATKEGALDSIKLLINEYYRSNYPDIVRANGNSLERMVSEVQKIYSRNYFPEMRVSWRQFPNQIGHMYYTGCFRCHNGKFNAGEKTLSKDCNVCHTILAQQLEKDTLRIALGGIEYRHPADVGDAWKEMNCSDCHGGQ